MRPFHKPPCFYRAVLATVACLVPAPQRPQWRSTNSAFLTSLWTLLQRGELPRSGKTLLAGFCRECFRNAVFTRCSPRQIVAALGHPVLPFAALTAVMLLTILTTQGLPTMSRLWSERSNPTDFVFGHAFVLTLAAFIALRALLSDPLTFHGWRSVLFLGAKTTLAMLTLTCFWIESSSAVHASLLLRHEAWWAASRVSSTLAFLFACGWLAGWCIADQRLRCPSCLRRLALPVSLGSWASVLDPATTILVCPQGHGSLTTPEVHDSSPDQWTTMDRSWSSLTT
ncbi:MAG: hypothetical protein HY820_09630 [Acidobacteria bacterium]|nr:hypothetical protein [Acidobacteriota bacterium]